MNRSNASTHPDYLTREEALRRLQVKPQTLYAYVSRGYIRSLPAQAAGPTPRRGSVYSRDDVDKVRARSLARAGHGPAAASAMHWGQPVFPSAITDITPEGPRYRSRLALDLARAGVPFETVAEYLWTGDWSDELIAWDAEPVPDGLADLLQALTRLHPRPHVLQLQAQATLALSVAEGSFSERIHAGGTPVVSARRLMHALAGVFGYLGPAGCFVAPQPGEPLALALARNLGVSATPEHEQALNAALVLAADHELSPATFAARIAASGRADLHACIVAALNVHYGSLIGRACDKVESLLEQPLDAAAVLLRVRRRLDAARMLPGFNHVLYPQGDPRARHLIALAREFAPERSLLMAIDRMQSEFNLYPGLEAALVILMRALGAPDHSAGGVLALARSAGWVAHVLEQRMAGFMIRPRAQFRPAPGAAIAASLLPGGGAAPASR